MSRAQAFRGHKMFSEGRNLAEDDQRSRRPATAWTGDNTAGVRELVRSDRRLTVQVIADKLNMSRETARLILIEELGMRKICDKMVHRNLTEQQQDARLSICADLQEQVTARPELSLVRRVGFSNMIQRPNLKVWNGVQRDHQGQRKRACPSQK